mmetsp:Transcript_85850/g.276124  ORF Transcript_85850/g.276124 Transcript_85850/m.276124 type:complete len:443 (-) Transcript_85850:369-1697(-)
MTAQCPPKDRGKSQTASIRRRWCSAAERLSVKSIESRSLEHQEVQGLQLHTHALQTSSRQPSAMQARIRAYDRRWDSPASGSAATRPARSSQVVLRRSAAASLAPAVPLLRLPPPAACGPLGARAVEHDVVLVLVLELVVELGFAALLVEGADPRDETWAVFREHLLALHVHDLALPLVTGLVQHHTVVEASDRAGRLLQVRGRPLQNLQSFVGVQRAPNQLWVKHDGFVVAHLHGLDVVEPHGLSDVIVQCPLIRGLLARQIKSLALDIFCTADVPHRLRHHADHRLGDIRRVRHADWRVQHRLVEMHGQPQCDVGPDPQMQQPISKRIFLGPERVGQPQHCERKSARVVLMKQFLFAFQIVVALKVLFFHPESLERRYLLAWSFGIRLIQCGLVVSSVLRDIIDPMVGNEDVEADTSAQELDCLLELIGVLGGEIDHGIE